MNKKIAKILKSMHNERGGGIPLGQYWPFIDNY